MMWFINKLDIKIYFILCFILKYIKFLLYMLKVYHFKSLILNNKIKTLNNNSQKLNYLNTPKLWHKIKILPTFLIYKYNNIIMNIKKNKK